MASRDAEHVGRENLIGGRPKNLLVNKAAVVLDQKTKRPALNDVGNRQITTNVRPAEKPALKYNLERKNSKTGKDIKPLTNVAYSTRRLSEDEQDRNDPLLVSEYIQNIYCYLRELETIYSIRPQHLTSHKTTSRMRCIVVDWMVEVHMNFALLPETLHLSVAVLDGYLQMDRTVGRENLQLVGIASLFIAAKYEEMYTPELQDYVAVSDRTFSKDQILKMELLMLKKLDFSLGRPLCVHFLRRYSKIAKVPPQHHLLGKYLLELSLVYYDLCHVAPSLRAAAALCLSVSILSDLTRLSDAWTEKLVRYSGYTYNDIRRVALTMADMLLKAEASKYQAVRSKYAASKFNKISLNPKLKSNLVKTLAIKANAMICKNQPNK